jgi:hypothetical protein
MPEIPSDNGHARLLRWTALTFWPFGHIELHGLPFLQAAESSCLNSGEMHEDILRQFGG